MKPVFASSSVREAAVRRLTVSFKPSQGLFVAVFLFLFLLIPSLGLAQGTGQGIISGVVTDQAGASIVSAKVIVTNLDTNVSVSRVSNASGFYEVDSLNPGRYSVEVSAASFEAVIQQGITLNADAHVDINLRLTAGRATETVTIVADAPLLTTESGQFGAVFSSEMLQGVPVNGDDPLQFAQLAAGVQTPNPQNVYTTATFNNPASVSQFGAYGRFNANEFSLDGTPNQGLQRATAYVASADEIGNMSVVTGGYDASIGHGYGVTITQTTKSGTNQLHGSIYDHYDARKGFTGLQHFQRINYQYHSGLDNCSAQPNSTACRFDQNQYGWPSLHENRGGATLGGPVYIPKIFDGRNKLFFFLSVIDNVWTDGTNTAFSVPTVQERAGDFSDFPVATGTVPAAYTTACGSSAPYYGQYQVFNPYSVTIDAQGIPRRAPFCGNKIPSTLISSMAATNIVSNLWPTPTTSGVNGNNYSFVQQIPQTYRAVSNRYDWSPSESNHFFARWNEMHYTFRREGFTVGSFDEYDTPRKLWQGAAGWSHVFSSKTFLDVTAGWNDFRGNYGFYPNEQKYKPSSLGLPSYTDAQAGSFAQFPILNFSNYTSIGNVPGAGIPIYIRTLATRANLVRVQGEHTIRAGAEWRLQNASGGGPGNPSGIYGFDDTYTQQNNGSDNAYTQNNYGLSYAAFLLGVQSNSSVVNTVSYSRSTPYIAFYAGDTWRVSRKLTIIPGIRYEFEYGPSEKHNAQIVGWDSTAPLPIAGAANAAYQSSYAGASAAVQAVLPPNLQIQGGPIYAGVNGAPTRQWNNNYRFLPRLAIAYQASTKTVLRAGYGLFFDTLNAPNETGAINQDGYSTTTTIAQTSTVYGTDFSASNVPFSNPFPLVNGSRFNVPVGNTLGASYYLGSTKGINDHNRIPARSQRGTISMQHQFGTATMVELAWAGSLTTNITLDANGDNSSTGAIGAENDAAVPGSFFAGGTQPNVTGSALLSTQVTNPFAIGNFSSVATTNPALYSQMSKNSYFTQAKIAIANLVRAYPQMTGLSIYRSIGESKFQSFQASVVRRIGGGLTLNGSLQWNYQKDRDYYANVFDGSPSWESSNLSRPYRVTASGVYPLPFGKNHRWAQQGWESKVFGGFRLAGTYELQPGALLTFPNLFYIGNTSSITLKHPAYYNNLALGGTAYIQAFNTQTATATYANNVCTYTGTGFVTNTQCQPNAYNLRVFPTHIEGLRQMGPNAMQASLQRTFHLLERVTLDTNIQCFNIFNRQTVGAANTSPTSTLFGQITTDGNGYPRSIQVEAKLRF